MAATLRRAPAVDFQTANAAQLEGLLDPQVLKVAADAGRLPVSHDKRTLPRHFAEFIVNQTSPGVVVVPQALPIAAAVEELLLIWHASEPEEWLNRIAHLPL